jgi:hypothetical protein
MDNNSKLRKLIRESIMEEIGNKTRYVATMEFYILSNDDQDAVKQAREIANNLDMNLDNRAAITNIVKQPHGTLGNTPIDFSE